MLYLHGAHRPADGIPKANGLRVNGTLSSVPATLTRTITAPKKTGDLTEDSSNTSETSLLLSWLLLLSRHDTEEKGITRFTWGRLLRDGADTAFPLPEHVESPVPALFAPHETVAAAANGLKKSLSGQRESNTTVGALTSGYTLFFSGGDAVATTAEASATDNDSGTRIDRSIRLEITALDEQLVLQAQWRDNTAMTKEDVEHHLDTFVDILYLVIQKPESTIRDALGSLESDLNRIWSWNATVPPKIDLCIHDIFSAQAAQIPDALAVSAWDGELTYRQVETLSSRLASKLVSLGVVVGAPPVPLCFEKSRWAVVAVLAVMKAGGTFALTDPSQPQARLKTIVEQTQARVIVTSSLQEDLGRRIGPDANICVVSDALLNTGHGQNTGDDTKQELDLLPNLPPVPPDTPMYIIFTSGSTGKPKGVVVSHANYTSGAIPRADAVGYAKDLRVFEFASYAFDVSIDCMLCTLIKGGCICVPSDEERMNNLSGAIRRSGAKMAHMTPSVARVLDPDILPSLDVLGLGGEAVSAGDAVAWSRHTSVVIAYGPSECTVGCTINNDVRSAKTYTNIGKGVGGLTWITDPADHNRLVPVGAVGELLVEGPVVGVGYLGEPEKTAEVFIEDPEWLVAGAPKNVPGRRGRLYKTGDLVRYDPDGSGAIVFVGRKDQQVKIRGQRVELVEIEHHLRDKLPYSGIRMVAEVIKPGGDDPTLVIFVEEGKTDGSSLSAASSLSDVEDGVSISPALQEALPGIDAALGEELPRYMVPTAYIPLAQIPSLVSGKTDRKKLRELGASMTRQQVASFRVVADSSKPETEAELALHSLWKQLLAVDSNISLSDSFFALGGDSLKAMKLVAAARAEGLQLTVASVFSCPTLREMAATAKKTDPEGTTAPPSTPFSLLSDGWTKDAARQEVAKLCDLDESVVEDIYPCTPLQEALMALSAKIKEAYVAQRVLDLKDLATAEKLQSAFETASDDCPILRTRIVQVPGRGLMQVVVREKIPWRADTSLQNYLETDRNEAMGLGKPLVRYGLVTERDTTTASEDTKTSFILTIHHSLYDGWSMPLVIDRVNKAYQGQPTPQRAPFKDFIGFLESLDRKECNDFWRDRLHGATGLQFPTLPSEGYQAKADSLLEHFVPLDRRPASNTTVATVIRGAWALVASCYTSCDDVVFGETLTGRNAPIPGVDEIEGPMITTVPVRVSINRSASVTQYLQSIHDGTVAQIPYEHTGLQNIRRLSDDALQACELRTGLVLHPGVEDEENEDFSVNPDQPANGLVPAGDAEAAQEALKFNTYSIMLVCSLTSKGFLVMASFDSNTVDKTTMEVVLRQFDLVTRRLCEETESAVGNIEFLTSGDTEDSWRAGSNARSEELGEKHTDMTGAWIVDPADPDRLLPRGAVGELLVQSAKALELPVLEDPKWLQQRAANQEAQRGQLFRTGLLAKIQQNESIAIRGRKDTSSRTGSAAAPKSKPPALMAASKKQKQLRTLWARVLRMEEDDISLGDNFFRLGGDSITAMKLVSEARLGGFELTVSQVFANRSLFDMAATLRGLPASKTSESSTNTSQYTPYSLLDVSDPQLFVEQNVRPQLGDQAWKVVDVLPVRPLQEIAIKGTIEVPKYSMRYEMLHFDSPLDAPKLLKACREVVYLNEILRTVFVEVQDAYLSVVLDHLPVPIIEYDVESSAEAFAQKICEVDVQEQTKLGASFVRFFLIHGRDGKSSLIFRISHAQYDEICLPILLHQLSALYEDRPVPESIPFSRFADHVIRENIPQSTEYWRQLLAGSTLTPFRPDIPVTSRRHYAVQKTVSIASRSKDVTIATLPTAAWALCLARRSNLRDVTFGEVVSGRSLDLPNADIATGPCWQYVPVRVRLEPGWTGADLLEAVQHQHIASSRFEGIGLREIVHECGTGWPAETDWFDSVVHQDVEHVEDLPFLQAHCRTQTLYLHEEPLREWKIQSFPSGDSMTLEIVTLESWAEYADGLLVDLADALETLVRRPWEPIVRE